MVILIIPPPPVKFVKSFVEICRKNFNVLILIKITPCDYCYSRAALCLRKIDCLVGLNITLRRRVGGYV